MNICVFIVCLLCVHLCVLVCVCLLADLLFPDHTVCHCGRAEQRVGEYGS